jgi:hypothetical protein
MLGNVVDEVEVLLVHDLGVDDGSESNSGESSHSNK